MNSVLYTEVDMEGDIYEIDESAEKTRKNEVKFYTCGNKGEWLICFFFSFPIMIQFIPLI